LGVILIGEVAGLAEPGKIRAKNETTFPRSTTAATGRRDDGTQVFMLLHRNREYGRSKPLGRLEK
jgi:hypothetical protein